MNIHVNLNLDKANSKVPTYIFHSVTFNKKRFRVNSGFKVLPAAWNPEKQEIRKTFDQNYYEKNESLKYQKAEIEKIFLQAKLTGIIPDKEYIFNKLSFSTKIITDRNFIFLFQEYIKSIAAINSPNTIKLCKTTLKHLESYSAKAKVELTFEKIDLRFQEKFTSFLLTEKNLQDNSITKYVKKLKTFLKWATNHGYNTNTDFTKIRVYERAIEIFPLSLEECDLLEKAELTTAQSRIRDLFLIECYTGLRFSDIQNLKAVNIQDDFISITTIKTRQRIKIPVSLKIKSILEKYFPGEIQSVINELPQISNQKMNEHLKEIMLKTGIVTPCIKIRYAGAKRIETTYPKYKLVTTHTGRQSFITNSLLLGIPSEIVMKIVGHTSYTTFKRYIKFTDQQLKFEMKAWENH